MKSQNQRKCNIFLTVQMPHEYVKFGKMRLETMKRSQTFVSKLLAFAL